MLSQPASAHTDANDGKPCLTTSRGRTGGTIYILIFAVLLELQETYYLSSSIVEQTPLSLSNRQSSPMRLKQSPLWQAPECSWTGRCGSTVRAALSESSSRMLIAKEDMSMLRRMHNVLSRMKRAMPLPSQWVCRADVDVMARQENCRIFRVSKCITSNLYNCENNTGFDILP